MLSVALVEPEIPPNTGNIARLCAAMNVPLHIVGVTGFRMDDRALRRAGLDYGPDVKLTRHQDLQSFNQALTTSRFV
jgi:tRNA (cytidine/uridine-2'-O-)-methyltransferase